MYKALCLLFLTIMFLSCSDVPDELCNPSDSSSSEVSPSSSSSSEQAHLHQWGEWETSKAPTCALQGEETQICILNAEHKEIRPVAINSTAHAYGEWEQTKAPTCEAAGEETRVCLNDASHKETQDLAQLSWGTWSITTSATPMLVGVETRTCPNNASPAQTRPLYPKCGTTEYDPADGKFCDKRDSKMYKYAKIGTQTWMAENLNYNASGSKCYNNDPANCTKYGRLYDWATAMALPPECNENVCAPQIQAVHRGICPSGWHIPNGNEWNELFAYVGGGETAGPHLKARSGWSDCGPSGSGNSYLCEDTYGFSALPGGGGWSGGDFTSSNNGYHWCYPELDGGITRAVISSQDNDTFWIGGTYKPNFMSIRCVED